MICQERAKKGCTDCPGEDNCSLLEPRIYQVSPNNPNAEPDNQRYADRKLLSPKFEPRPFTPYKETLKSRLGWYVEMARLTPALVKGLIPEIPGLTRLALEKIGENLLRK